MNWGRRSVAVDLKHPDGVEVVLSLAAESGALIEASAPAWPSASASEPEPCPRRNPRLVYGRMTGWGQDGPYAAEAGHDITYAAVAVAPWPHRSGGPAADAAAEPGGRLRRWRHAARPRRRLGRAVGPETGHGQVVGAAMVDGVALLMAPFFMALRSRFFTNERGTNLLDSGAPFYDSYACADGRYVAVGALEPQFCAALVAVSASAPRRWASRTTRPTGPQCARFAATFLTRTRDEWVAHFAGRDACVAPVSTTEETLADAHLVAGDRGRGRRRPPARPAPYQRNPCCRSTVPRRGGRVQRRDPGRPGLRPRHGRRPPRNERALPLTRRRWSYPPRHVEIDLSGGIMTKTGDLIAGVDTSAARPARAPRWTWPAWSTTWSGGRRALPPGRRATYEGDPTAVGAGDDPGRVPRPGGRHRGRVAQARVGQDHLDGRRRAARRDRVQHDPDGVPDPRLGPGGR